MGSAHFGESVKKILFRCIEGGPSEVPCCSNYPFLSIPPPPPPPPPPELISSTGSWYTSLWTVLGLRWTRPLPPLPRFMPTTAASWCRNPSQNSHMHAHACAHQWSRTSTVILVCVQSRLQYCHPPLPFFTTFLSSCQLDFCN